MTKCPSDVYGHCHMTCFKFGGSSPISGTNEATVIRFCLYLVHIKSVVLEWQSASP